MEKHTVSAYNVVRFGFGGTVELCDECAISRWKGPILPEPYKRDYQGYCDCCAEER